MEALQAATIDPARFSGKKNELGTVENDKLADLFRLEANRFRALSKPKTPPKAVRGSLAGSLP
jgi:imidazolonepropionase-like amidohydrolase